MKSEKIYSYKNLKQKNKKQNKKLKIKYTF